MVKAVIDTCILIDYLKGVEDAKEELLQYSEKLISSITWMEVMIGATAENEQATRTWLNQRFSLVPVSQSGSEAAVVARRKFRIKLPNAIIFASAKTENCLFVTRNTKDFTGSPSVRIPYKL